MSTQAKSKPSKNAAKPARGGASPIGEAKLIEIYAAMLKCSMLREQVRVLAKSGELRRGSGFRSGSEAVAAAVLTNVQPGDPVILSESDVFSAVARGIPLKAILTPYLARASSAQDDFNNAYADHGVLAGPFASTSHNIAAGSLAAGAAFTGKFNGDARVSVVFYRGADTDAQWRDVLNFAVVHDLPIIFVRQAASASPAAGRKAGRQSKKIEGMPRIPVDSSDAIAIYRVAHEAIAHARRGNGPTLIDCLSLRLPGEAPASSVAKIERYLTAKGIPPKRIKSKVAVEFNRAFRRAITAPARSGKSRAKRSAERRGKGAIQG